ncbi:reverse transcriptase [Corchorus capsularis]|uniref:Reverse transcriptase n=1 Tax=Corchorus capsularis TaxID=210143 RepID=A0A1R3G421_COCAP|nr:reverse transcriptase [Corchorus capsularis]
MALLVKGVGQFWLGKHTTAANSHLDGRRLGGRHLGKMSAWLAEHLFNSQARNWKRKVVVGASENIGEEDVSAKIVKVVTRNKGVVAKDKGLSVLTTENLVYFKNFLVKVTDESPSPAGLHHEGREGIPSVVQPNTNIPGVGPASLGPVLQSTKMDGGLPSVGNPINICSDPVGATGPNAVKKLLHKMAAISPFVFGMSSSSNVKKPRKWKKTARVSSKYSFEAFAPQSNLKDGRKRGTGVSTQETTGSGMFKRTRDNIAVSFQNEVGAGTQVVSEARREDGVDANDPAATPITDLFVSAEMANKSHLPEAMNCLVWNCRGLGASRERVDDDMEKMNQRYYCVSGLLEQWQQNLGGSGNFVLNVYGVIILIFFELLRVLGFSNFGDTVMDKVLLDWDQNVFGDIKQKIKLKQKEFEKLYQQGSVGEDSSNLEFFHQELNELHQQEEVMWHQRLKSLWLRDVDRNTRYFHTVASSRRQRSIISSIYDDSGACFSDAKSIERIILEIKAVVFQIEGDKAPGPDGMTQAFFQQRWGLIGKDVASFFGFSEYGKLLPSINHTNIVLIPKTASSNLAKDYRPISLCNVIFKIISKALANRLKLVLPNLIGDNQSVFVPDRMIYDNTMIAFETIHFMRNKRFGHKAHMALKLDLSKAYDIIEWDFLEDWVHCAEAVEYLGGNCGSMGGD